MVKKYGNLEVMKKDSKCGCVCECVRNSCQTTEACLRSDWSAGQTETESSWKQSKKV